MSDPTNEGLVYINGEYFPTSQAKLPIMDSGFLMGLNVFDTMSLHEGYLFRLEAHLDRFFRSLQAVRFELPHSRADFEQLVLDTIRRSGLRDANVNTIATHGPRQRGIPVEQWPITVIVMVIPPLIPLTPEKRADGYRMRISSVRNVPIQTLDAQVKNYNRLFSYLATLEAHDAGADDVLMLDLDGYLTEGPSFNVFAVRQGRIYTPVEGVLHGITRDTTLKIAEREGIPVIETRLTPYDLYNADEVFFTSTSRGAVGIVEIDRREIGNGRPGPITERLNDIYWTWHKGGPYVTPVYEQAAVPVTRRSS
jgi:branched-chain amino acid aminotransferase